MTATNPLIGVLVLGLVIWRQLIPRRVRSNMRIVLVLAVIGLIQTGQYRPDLTSHGTARGVAGGVPRAWRSA